MNHPATQRELVPDASGDITVHPRMCPICEANCGLLVAADRRSKKLIGIRGDDKDPLSQGFLCAKGYAWTELHEDPNVIKTPLIKRNGEFVPATWDEALDLVGERLNAIRQKHGANAVGFYIGNPIAHKPGLLFYAPAVLEKLASCNVFSASSVDTNPKFLASALMYGDCSAVAIPDVDRTDFFVIQGGNPVVSNGSLLTAPGMAKRIKAIRARGGKVVVIDPRRTETAEIADQYIAIRPGTDAWFLLAVVHQLFAEGLVRLRGLEGRVRGVETVQALVAEYSPERVTSICGVPPAVIRQLARDFAAADAGAWYGRFGACTQRFGTLVSWLQDVINALSGNIDRPGGVMFPAGFIPSLAFNDKIVGDVVPVNRWQSRVSGYPEFAGLLPTAALPEEILTPGDGQIRAFITMAGNPVLSTPNSQRLSKAFDSLEFMVSLDIYVNETTRHADVILPSPPHAMHSDYPLFYVYLSVRNVPKWGEPIFPLEEGQRHDWQILQGIAARIGGVPAEDLEEAQLQAMIKKCIAEGRHPRAREVDPLAARAALGNEPGPDRLYDLLIRTGRFGDAFGLDPAGLNLQKLKQQPHGIDLGPMVPNLDEVLATPDRKIDLAPAYIVADMERLRTASAEYGRPGTLMMIGRREPRTNNSWTHNLHVLAKGRNRCTALLHPADAARLGLADGDRARVSTAVASIEIAVELTESIMPGVVSIPHGWGHDEEGTRLDIARRNPGANFNKLVDERVIDVPSANAVLSGVAVTVEAVSGG
ncbi:MAG: molybdopterin-dependent oxidoreductase [Rhodocyclaceae bacterium]|nr:molybdopterin-dependent oxidoreductase [Rhodocyclaceae bacterium]